MYRISNFLVICRVIQHFCDTVHLVIMDFILVGECKRGINCIPWNMHMVLLCFVLLWLWYGLLWFVYPYSSGLLQWHSASEVTLKDMGKIGKCQTTKISPTHVHNSWDIFDLPYVSNGSSLSCIPPLLCGFKLRFVFHVHEVNHCKYIMCEMELCACGSWSLLHP